MNIKIRLNSAYQSPVTDYGNQLLVDGKAESFIPLLATRSIIFKGCSQDTLSFLQADKLLESVIVMK
jgi:hypothetical protein